MQVGVKLGTEIAPGRFLLDVDFDWTPGIVLAPMLLPRTAFGMRRQSKRLSHAFYTTSRAVASCSYDDPVDKKPLVELRGTKADGEIGFQTMVWPSVHLPSGESIELTDGEITHDDTVPDAVRIYAMTCLLLKYLGPRAFTHELRLAASGFLIQDCALPQGTVLTLLESLARATRNDVKDVAHSVKTTASRGEHVKRRKALEAGLGEHGRAITTRLLEWAGHDGEGWALRGGRKCETAQQNVRIALRVIGAELSYDRFARQALVTYQNKTVFLDDAIRNRLWIDIEEICDFRPQAHLFDVMLDVVARERSFHPVLDYLDGLHWDGQPRIDNWLSTYGGATASEYARAVGALVLIAAVRRVRQPGCKFDEMLVLVSSAQGTNKSSAIQCLCPRDTWFSDDLPLNVTSKEVIERTGGRWIIEASELSGMRKSRVEHLKSMLSRQVDGPVRMAYAHKPVYEARQFITIGTTNAQSFLKDPTGNRRFWPVVVKVFDLAALARDRDQLWAEAAHRERAGESIRLREELWKSAAREQEDHEVVNPWIEVLEPEFGGDRPLRVIPEHVWTYLGVPVSRRMDRDAENLAAAMEHFGFRRMTVRDEEGRPIRGWGRGEAQSKMGWKHGAAEENPDLYWTPPVRQQDGTQESARDNLQNITTEPGYARLRERE